MAFKAKADPKKKRRGDQEKLLLHRARPWPTQVPGFRLEAVKVQPAPRAFALLGNYESNDGIEVTLKFVVREESFEEFRGLVNRAMAEEVLKRGNF